MPRSTLLLVLVLFVPMVVAHQGHGGGLDEQLVDRADRLMVGRFAAEQPGPLLVVPYLDGPLPCGPAARGGFLVPLSGDAGVTFLANATTLRAAFDAPTRGYLGLAVDTHVGVRALLLMQERAVSLHWLAAHGSERTPNGSVAAVLKAGQLGIPYEVPGAGMHSMGVDLEGGGVAMDYEAPVEGVAYCDGSTPDRHGLSFERARLPDALGPGRVVHAVALYDPQVDRFLPRPLDSTQVLQVNLYLSRPGEDPEDVRAALDPRLGVADGVPLLALVAGVAWASRSR